ncbi:MAG: WecB/TagA/CpsF family glycosyltransferase, partial [Planctomycetota bacterium]|nr:WecB/TagA/CpsF family glycosyltransferase [Planctomycetota bacterium]
MDALRMEDAGERVFDWIESPAENCQFVVTPNVDHTVILSENEHLRAAYEEAGMVLADGHPVVLASRLLRKPLPERVPGSDLVPRLFDESGTRGPITVFLLGAAEGVAERAAERIHGDWENVQVVGTYSPPIGFENDIAEESRILSLIDETSPDLLVVGLGAPKQELWTHRHFRSL